MRNDDYRFTAWVPFDNSTMRGDWDSHDIVHGLYDLRQDDGRDFDFDGYASNVAELPEHKELVQQLYQTLKEHVNTFY